jgi:hypothetical protein
MKFKTFISEANAGADVVKVTVPMFVRLLEWAREEAKNDMDIHKLTEKIVSKKGVIPQMIMKL